MFEVTKIRDNMVLITVLFMMVLNYGFMLFRPVDGIPIGEIVLLLSLLMINHKVVLPKFIKSPLMIPFVVWVLLGVFHILLGIFNYGFWAIRDGSHVIESLFLYVGFGFAGRRESLDKLIHFMPVLVTIVVLYGLTYPFREILLPLSPILHNASCMEVPLLFGYTNTAMMLVVVSAYLLHRHFVEGDNRLLMGAALVLTIPLLLIPSRMLYIQIIFFLMYFAFLGGGSLKFRKVLTVTVIPFFIIALIFGSGITVYGRFGENFEFSDYLVLFYEIFGGFNSEATVSSGNALRLAWWGEVLSNWSQSWTSILLGQGYGFPLVDFVSSSGTLVRDPHNDFVGIVARMGIFALIAFIWIQAIIIFYGIRAVRFFKTDPTLSSLIVVLLFVVCCTLLHTVGESPFSMSFFAIPHYFCAGIIYRLEKIRQLSVKEEQKLAG